VGCCEHSDEPLGSIKCGGFLDRLRNCWLQQACALCRRSVTLFIVNTLVFYRPTFVKGPCMVLVWILLAKCTVPLVSDHCTWYWTTLRVTADWTARGQLHIREVPSSGPVRETDFLEVFWLSPRINASVHVRNAHMYCTSRFALTSVSGHRTAVLGDKTVRAWSWPLSLPSSEVRKDWSRTSTGPYACRHTAVHY
jgi:hypothetical protein